MKTPTLLLSLAAILAAPADAAPAKRNFGVAGFTRIRVEGDYRVTVTNGVAPFARATGDRQALDRIAIGVTGTTLTIRADRTATSDGFAGRASEPVEIMIGTHELEKVTLTGPGLLTIDRVDGLKFDASAEGAGGLAIGDARVDQLSLTLLGSASARVAGKAGKVTALVRGSGALDASGLAAKDAAIGAEGPVTVRMTVTDTAKVTTAGVATVALEGGPTCTVNGGGSAVVSGCR